MRKPRVIVFDDDVMILEMLTAFFSKRNYEVVAFNEPLTCPIYVRSADDCTKEFPCADIVITDLRMPKMNGIELISDQAQRGCKLDVKNKAIMSGDIDEECKKKIKELGCSYLNKPFTLNELSDWLSAAEERIDLSQPLNILEKRRHARYPHNEKIEYCCHTDSEVLTGLTIDMSDSGMRLYVFREHPEGQDILLKSVLPVQREQGTIRWIKNLQNSHWIAGVMFS